MYRYPHHVVWSGDPGPLAAVWAWGQEMKNENDCKGSLLNQEQVKALSDLIDERELILEMVESRRAWNAMGKLAGSLKAWLGWVIAITAMWVTFKANALQWLHGALPQ